jgi:hypothetical protein
MKLIIDHPPNIETIDAAFHVRDLSGVIYSYAPAIYCPSGPQMPKWIIEHEKIHIERQGGSPDAWWERYIADEEFRYQEELVAHVRELQYRKGGKDGKKYSHSALLNHTVDRLLAPIYHYTTIGRPRVLADIMERL